MKRRLLIFMLIPLLFTSSCEKNASGALEAVGGIYMETDHLYPKDFLFLDNESVSFEEFRYYYLNYKKMYLEKDSAFFDTEENEEKLKSDITAILLDNRGIRLLAKENGLTLTETDRKTVEEEIKKAKKTYGETNFSENLTASFMTEGLYKKTLEDALLSLKLFNSLFEEGGKHAWDEKTYYTYFKEHFLCAEIVLFPYGEKETKTNCEKSMKEAEEFAEKLKGGEDFYPLIASYKDTLVFREGDSYQDGQMEDALFQAANSLKAGNISSPVIGEEGIYLIRRIEDTPALMEKKRQELLFGTTDEKGVFHPGAYDKEYISQYKERAKKIEVTFGENWKEISTKTVF